MFIILSNDLSSNPLDDLLSRMPEEIRRRSSVRTIAAGETITKKGGEANCVFILLKGEARVVNEFPNGERYIFAQITSKDFIGEVENLADETEYSSNVEAITDCKIMVLAAKSFSRWFEQDPLILMAISKIIAKKLYLTSSQTGTVKFYSGIHKLQAYIIRYCSNIKAEETFLINRNRQQIADEIGTSVKTVNRSIQKLKANGLLLVKRGKIHISTDQYTNMLAEIDSI